jgi:hypothetical protein
MLWALNYVFNLNHLLYEVYSIVQIMFLTHCVAFPTFRCYEIIVSFSLKSNRTLCVTTDTLLIVKGNTVLISSNYHITMYSTVITLYWGHIGEENLLIN